MTLVIGWLRRWGWAIFLGTTIVSILIAVSATRSLSGERAARQIVADQLAREVETAKRLRQADVERDAKLATIEKSLDQTKKTIEALDRAGLVDRLNKIPRDQWPWIPLRSAPLWSI
jgi:hypothetical protein